MCGYRYISELERSDPAFHSPVQSSSGLFNIPVNSHHVPATCQFVNFSLTGSVIKLPPTDWHVSLQTLVQYTTSVINVPLLSNSLCQVCLIQISWLKCTSFSAMHVYSIQLKLKQLSARIARYVVHVDWCALFYFIISDFYVSQ